MLAVVAVGAAVALGIGIWLGVRAYQALDADWVGPWPEEPGLPRVLDGVRIGTPLDEAARRRPELFAWPADAKLPYRDGVALAGVDVGRNVRRANGATVVLLSTPFPGRSVRATFDGPERQLAEVTVVTSTAAFPKSWGPPTIASAVPGAADGPIWLDASRTVRFYRFENSKVVQRFTPFERLLGDALEGGLAGLRPGMSTAELHTKPDGDVEITLGPGCVDRLRVYGRGDGDGRLEYVYTWIRYGPYEGYRDQLLDVLRARWGPPTEARPDGTLWSWHGEGVYGHVIDDPPKHLLEIRLRSEPTPPDARTRAESEEYLADVMRWLGPFPHSPGPPQRLKDVALGSRRADVRRTLSALWPSDEKLETIEIYGTTLAFDISAYASLEARVGWSSRTELDVTLDLDFGQRRPGRLDAIRLVLPGVGWLARLIDAWGPPAEVTGRAEHVWFFDGDTRRAIVRPTRHETNVSFEENIPLSVLLGDSPSEFPLGRPELIGTKLEDLRASFVVKPGDPMQIDLGYCGHLHSKCYARVRLDGDRVESIEVVLYTRTPDEAERTWQTLQARWGPPAQLMVEAYEFEDSDAAVLVFPRASHTVLFAPADQHVLRLPLYVTEPFFDG
ncbi:MAG: hypothetical protein RMA76_01600 [Deltaproteobacteria bacterium]